jgi:hypothetical protein
VSTADDIKRTCEDICALLLRKNKAYGDSVFSPINLVSKATVTERLWIRIEDKLSRLARGEDAGEDTITDLIGYFIMLKIATRTQAVGKLPFSTELASERLSQCTCPDDSRSSRCPLATHRAEYNKILDERIKPKVDPLVRSCCPTQVGFSHETSCPNSKRPRDADPEGT